MKRELANEQTKLSREVLYAPSDEATDVVGTLGARQAGRCVRRKTRDDVRAETNNNTTSAVVVS